MNAADFKKRAEALRKKHAARVEKVRLASRQSEAAAVLKRKEGKK